MDLHATDNLIRTSMRRTGLKTKNYYHNAQSRDDTYEARGVFDQIAIRKSCAGSKAETGRREAASRKEDRGKDETRSNRQDGEGGGGQA